MPVALRVVRTRSYSPGYGIPEQIPEKMFAFAIPFHLIFIKISRRSLYRNTEILSFNQNPEVVMQRWCGCLCTLLLFFAVSSPSEQLVRELFDGEGADVPLSSFAGGPSSFGFEAGSSWTEVGDTEFMLYASNFNVVEGAPDTLPGLPALAVANGGIYGAGTWSRPVATRPLDLFSTFDFGSDDVLYFSVRLNNGGDSAAGFGFADTGDNTGSFVGTGLMWNNTGPQGGAANNAPYISQGSFAAEDTPYLLDVWGTAQTIDGRGTIVGRITTVAAGNDSMDIKVYLPNDTIPTDPSTITWDVTHSFDESMFVTHAMVWLNGYGGQIDALRLARDYKEVVGIEAVGPNFLPATTVPTGASITGTVTGAVAPVTYQWRKNGVDILGATTDTLILTDLQPADAGGVDVVVSNAWGAVTTPMQTIVITGTEPPAITDDPSGATRYIGANQTFTVTASGSPPFTYQWLKDGAGVPGGNAASLALSNLVTGDAGSYTVIVSNEVNAATSAAAVLAVLEPTAGTYAEAILNDPGVVAYWRLDEPSGTDAFDALGNYDAVHTNVIVGTIGPRSTSFPLAFPGFEAANLAVDYDTTGTNTPATETSAPLMSNREQFSILGWFRPQGPQGGRTGLFGQNDVAEFGYHGTNLVGLWTQSGGYANFDAGLVTDDEWHFLVASGDGENLVLYMDGNMMSTDPFVTTNYGNNVSHPFRIGGGGILDTGGNHFNGIIDEVTVLDHSLTALQVSELYDLARGQGTPPHITIQPMDVDTMINQDVSFSLTAGGSLPLAFQWRKEGTDLVDGANLSGSQDEILRLFNLTTGEAGNYDVVISNVAGVTTSEVAVLTIGSPPDGSPSIPVLSMKPLAYWRFNEDPVTDPPTVARDLVGGHHATYLGGTEHGLPGPRPPEVSGWETNNVAVQTTNVVANGWCDMPALNVASNAMTIVGWIYPYGEQTGWAGILFSRASGTTAGLNYGGVENLRYHWAGGQWGWDSGLTVPTDQWSFIALTVAPDKATMYLGGEDGTMASSENAVEHVLQTFSGAGRIGADPNNNARVFVGKIDELAVFGRTLSASEISELHDAGLGALESFIGLEIGPDGKPALVWDTGDLETSFEAEGPYTPVPGAMSPYTIQPVNPQEFFRVAE